MGNPQGTLTAYIAGLMEGEGSVWIGKVLARGKYSYRSTVMFTNTEPALVQVFIGFLDSLGLAYYLRTDDRKAKGRKVCYQLQITKDSDKLTFLQLLEPYLVGLKKKSAIITIEYLNHRMSQFAEVKRRRLPNGRYGPAVDTKHGVKEEGFFQRYKAAKDTSETICRTPHDFGRRYSPNLRESVRG